MLRRETADFAAVPVLGTVELALLRDGEQGRTNSLLDLAFLIYLKVAQLFLRVFTGYLQHSRMEKRATGVREIKRRRLHDSSRRAWALFCELLQTEAQLSPVLSLFAPTSTRFVVYFFFFPFFCSL
jgi:hypothetical protein